MLPAILRELRRNSQRPAAQVEHVVGEVEPEVLSRADLAGYEDEAPRVLRELRPELIELRHRQSAAAPRLVLNRRNVEYRCADALASCLRVC
jgi:hypothetical protein